MPLKDEELKLNILLNSLEKTIRQAKEIDRRLTKAGKIVRGSSPRVREERF